MESATVKAKQWLATNAKSGRSTSLCRRHIVADLLAENEKQAEVLLAHDRWLQGGVYYTNEEAASTFGYYTMMMDSMRARIAKLEQDLAMGKLEAESLAKSLHRQYFSEVTQWGLCDSVAGVISQIDNMVTGIPEIVKKQTAQACIEIAIAEKRDVPYSRETPASRDHDYACDCIVEAIKARFKRN